MDYQSYEDYMRNTLNYSGMGSPMGMQGTSCPNMNCQNMCITPYSNMSSNQMMWQDSSCDLERMYPDSYRVVYPMVVSTCRNVSMPVTEDMIDRMTDDIYDRAVADGRINVDISVELETKEDSKEEDRQMINRPPRRRRRNRFFRDLIRILLLRELIGRRPGFPRF
ncbi:MAG: hypothetical protein ACI4VC_04065 [Clostridia bacterium]